MKVESIDTSGFYKMALQGAGFKVTDHHAELIVHIVKAVGEKKGDLNLRDIANIQFNVNGIFGLDENGEPRP